MITDSPRVVGTASADVLVLADKQLVARDVALCDCADRMARGCPTGPRAPTSTSSCPTVDTAVLAVRGPRGIPSSTASRVLREAGRARRLGFVHDSSQVGDKCRFGGPRNNFRLGSRRTATSSSPAESASRPSCRWSRASAPSGADWQLLYCGRGDEGMAFADELAGRRRGPPVAQRRTRRGRPAGVDRRVHAKTRRCTPAGPLRSSTPSASTHHIGPRGWVRIERFTATQLRLAGATTAFDDRVDGAGRGARCTSNPASPILDRTPRRAGVRILSSCRAGVCGTCETAVLAGEPDHRTRSSTTTSGPIDDCFFLCVSRARTRPADLALYARPDDLEEETPMTATIPQRATP